MTYDRFDSIKEILKECFWGDYSISAEDIMDRLDKNDTVFIKFLFSKIIENSRYPSRYIKNLFPQATYITLINEYEKKAGDKKRFRLIHANLTGNYDNVPEYQWKR